MALTRITKGVIKPNENYDTHNINSTGIVTATGANITGNLTVGGVLTYEDVTSIDSVGIVTGAAGDFDDFVDVGSNIKLGNAGVITATSFVGSGAALTGIDATAIKDSGGNVKIQAQASGAIHSGVSTFQDLDVDGHTNLDNVSVAGVTTITSSTFPLVVHADTSYQGILVNGNGAPTVSFAHQNTTTPDWKIGLSGGNHTALAISEGTGNTNRLTLSAGGGGSISGTFLATNLGIDGNLFHNSDTDTKLQFGTDTIDLRTGGSSRISITNTGASVTGNLNVSGVLTYDDVTNVDAVGIITARAGIVVSGGTVTIPTVAGTNTNASLNVLFQTAAGVIDGGSALTYNPAQDVLSVNGNHISRQVFRGDGALGMFTCDNHSSTTFVNVSNTIDISTVDNTSGAFTLKEGSNEYISVDTSNSSELIKFGTAGC